MGILAILLFALITQQGTSKAKPKIYVYPETTYTSAFKASFLHACQGVELSEAAAESKYKAEVGSAEGKFTWILRDRGGKVLSFDERSSMEDATISLCKAAKENK